MKATLFTIAGALLAAIANAAPANNIRAPAEQNTADPDLSVPIYIIASHKREEDPAAVAKRSVDELMKRKYEGLDGANENMVIAYIVGGGDTDAYAKYVEAADAKEVLGE